MIYVPEVMCVGGAVGYIACALFGVANPWVLGVLLVICFIGVAAAWIEA